MLTSSASPSSDPLHHPRLLPHGSRQYRLNRRLQPNPLPRRLRPPRLLPRLHRERRVSPHIPATLAQRALQAWPMGSATESDLPGVSSGRLGYVILPTDGQSACGGNELELFGIWDRNDRSRWLLCGVGEACVRWTRRVCEEERVTRGQALDWKEIRP
jgi:hypothetical protein